VNKIDVCCIGTSSNIERIGVGSKIECLKVIFVRRSDVECVGVLLSA
jgi:hypothetical protein